MDYHHREDADTGIWPTECPHGCMAGDGEVCAHGYPALKH